MKPAAVSRMLHFFPGPEFRGARTPGEPLAATICKVWSETMVNLVVFDENGNMYPMTSIAIITSVDDIPAYGYARWPEYHPDISTGTNAASETLAPESELSELPDKADVEPEDKPVASSYEGGEPVGEAQDPALPQEDDLPEVATDPTEQVG